MLEGGRGPEGLGIREGRVTSEGQGKGSQGTWQAAVVPVLSGFSERWQRSRVLTEWAAGAQGTPRQSNQGTRGLLATLSDGPGRGAEPGQSR